MSNRRTYLAHELRAGHTVFIVTRAFVDHATGEGRYEVAEHLVASKGEPQPEPGQLPPADPKPCLARAGRALSFAPPVHPLR